MKTHTLNNIVIIGAGGFGKEVLWTINDINKQKNQFKVIGFLDENKSLYGKKINNIPVLGGLEFLEDHQNLNCVIAIGDGMIRKKIIKKIESNVKFPNLIHPSVIKSDSVKIDEGCIIQAGCILTTNIKIDKHVHMNLFCTIGHDCQIEDYVTLSPGVHINGQNTICTGSYFGSGSITKESIKIGSWSILGAGAVLTESIPKNSLCVGIPGKIIKKINSKNRPKL